MNLLPTLLEFRAAVLRQAFFGNIHPAENLHPREQRLALGERQPRVVVHFPVEPEAHEEAVLLRLEMNVARLVGDGGPQDRIERLGGIDGRYLRDKERRGADLPGRGTVDESGKRAEHQRRCGVRKITSSLRVLRLALVRNARPRNGIAERNGTERTVSPWSSAISPPMTAVSPSRNRTMVDACFTSVTGAVCV